LVILDTENIFEDLSLKAQGLKILQFQQLVEEGQKNKLPWAPVTPDSIYAFSYTSGTTGDSKGAMMSHKNICSVVSSV